ncbi:hypothetical protein NSK_003819 [Nannochloropsis salina CCMP1776]|uniref:Uncharacterized protein n=1 Tax=Nannochloropsis salina CCMP1776 TaxID=1027361 RepID=A0A4D9D327_9STRA|nr:hypothetical protein NSK_003819 [Nannochloropsis salina CCMP1776]|eukprot:TFJ84787.1 hypothetical protein NSK_003819 [Nannochloropsis salina CCMP1776]
MRIFFFFASFFAFILAQEVVRGFTGSSGGFSLSEIPEDLLDEDGASIVGNADGTDSWTSPISLSRTGGRRSGSLANHAMWNTLREQSHKALLPSIATVLAGATGRILHKRYASVIRRAWHDHRSARHLGKEKRRLEREIQEEQGRYQQEMRRISEEQEELDAAEEAEIQAKDELRRARFQEVSSMPGEDEEQAHQRDRLQQQQHYRPDLKRKSFKDLLPFSAPSSSRRTAEDWRSVVGELETKIDALQREVREKAEMVSRLQSSKVEELNSARSVVDQLRKELEGARGMKEHLEGQLRQSQVRLQTLKDQVGEGQGQKEPSENDLHLLRTDLETRIRQEYAESRAQDQEAWAREVRHQTVAEITAQTTAEREKYEADLIELYRRRLKEEVAKRDAVMEERLQAQDVEYRRQCEELRLKVQGLLRERDHSLRDKLVLHAREWQQRVGAKGGASKRQRAAGGQAPVRVAGSGVSGSLFRGKGASAPSKVPRGGASAPTDTVQEWKGTREGGLVAELMDAEEAEARASTRAVGAREGGQGVPQGGDDGQEPSKLVQQQRQWVNWAASGVGLTGVGGGGSGRRATSGAVGRRGGA